MAIMDVVRTVMYAVPSVVLLLGMVFVFLMVLVSVLCPESVEEHAEAERRDALAAEVEYALARWHPAEPAPVLVMPPVVPPSAAAAAKMVKLGYFPYSAGSRRASEKLVCAICLEVFEQGEKCSEVPACRHLFHTDCIDVWMKTKTTCPLCRGDVVAGAERLSAAEDMV